MAQIETLGGLGGLPELSGASAQLGGVGTPAPAVNGELGATGTPIFSGFLRELGEYNPNFSAGPFSAFLLYEQMRRSDGQVAAVLDACKLPILGAEWTIVPPEDATDAEKEAAEFIEEQLFVRCRFKQALRNAMLMLDFGCAVHEDVYVMDGGKVCLAEMAPRLPLTFYRWITDAESDKLQGLDQLGYRGGNYVHCTIPLNKMALFTFQMEGRNYAGRALTRAMYQHWYMKQALYTIDAIALERNGLGVPVVTMGEKAKLEDKNAALAWVTSLVAHEKAGMVLPPGWTFKLEGITGQVRDCEKSITHHNMMIAMVALAQFIVMGQSGRSSGNRSLGETMSDFFFLGQQATADYIGEVWSNTTIKRLMEFNFGPGVRPPTLEPQDLLASKIETLGTVLAGLAGKQALITPDADLEAWLRKKLGAPEALPDVGGDDPEDAGATQQQQNTQQRPQKYQPVGPGEQFGRGKPVQEAGAAPAGGRKVAGSAVARRAPKTARQAQAEQHLALDEIVSGLDKGRDDAAAALRAARPRVQAEVVHKLVDSNAASAHRVTVAPDEKLRAEMRKVLGGVHEFGRGQVERERARQLSGKPPGDAATVRMSDRSGDPLGLYADGVVSEFTNNVQQRATNVALDYLKKPGDMTKGEIIQAIGDDLDDQSDGWIDNLASEGSNEAFAQGREAGYQQYKDEIASVVYSALLDINTCGQCADADGQEGDTPGDIPDVPNPDCDGGDKCRCVHVYVFGDEGKAAA